MCISIIRREQIGAFDSFWNIGSYERQKDCVCSQIDQKKTTIYLKDNDEQQEKKRMVARTYSLETSKTESIICKKIFEATLDTYSDILLDKT